MDNQYVMVHKEFTKDHKVITTILGLDKGETYRACLAQCEKVNKKGFVYKPYLKSDIMEEIKER